MDREILLKQSPTAQVRLLTLEVLSDGQVHSRKDFVEYVKKVARNYGFENYSMGCISGGIQQAVNSGGCEKIGSATYQMTSNTERLSYSLSDSDSAPGEEDENLSVKSAEICKDFAQKLVNLSRTVDFVSADDKALEQLMQMRECISDINGWIEKFQKQALK